MSSRKGGLSGGTKTALPAGIQTGSRQALPLFGQVDPDGQGARDCQRVTEEVIRQHEVDAGEREGLLTTPGLMRVYSYRARGPAPRYTLPEN